MFTGTEAEQAELEFCAEYAPTIYDAIVDILGKMSVSARVSYRIVEEVVIHFWRDMERLYAIHHKEVHVTKSCSYVAFWVRKLKPISGACQVSTVVGLTPTQAPPLEAEITDINERVALFLALRLLRNCIRDRNVIEIEGYSNGQILSAFDRGSDEYLQSKIEDGMSMGLRFESMVYDMRFRTYGPHHLTPFLVHIMREVYQECKKPPKS